MSEDYPKGGYCTICGAKKWVLEYDRLHGCIWHCPQDWLHNVGEAAGKAHTPPTIARDCPICRTLNWHDARYCEKCRFELQKERI